MSTGRQRHPERPGEHPGEQRRGVEFPPDADASWLETRAFTMPFTIWQRELVVREEGAKTPADLSDDIDAALPDRDHIGPILDSLRRFATAR